jgi:CHAD domain-containing protein
LNSGKWFDDLTATTPLAEAALRVLDIRLGIVGKSLALALDDFARDPEHVHKLRVGTRRAAAALEVFAACLPGKTYDKARKQLRRLRRAAGAARDWDVFLQELTAEAQQDPRHKRPGLDFLTGYALGQRLAAQAGLQEANPDHSGAFRDLEARVRKTVGPPHHGPATLIELACPVLTAQLKDLELAAARDLDDYDNLHQVRIAGKHLRYAMEIFAFCFPPVFRDVHYPAVEQMQEILGRANDSHVAAGRLRALGETLRQMLPRAWRRYRSRIEALLHLHEQRLPEERGRFEEWWRQWRQEGAENALHAVLRGEPPASGEPPA